MRANSESTNGVNTIECRPGHLVYLLNTGNDEGKLFAIQSMLISAFERKYNEIYLLPLIKKLEDPNQTIRNWAACTLCYLADNTFHDLPLLQQYTENLLDIDDPLWTRPIIEALRQLHTKHQYALTPLAIEKIANMRSIFSLNISCRKDILLLIFLNIQNQGQDQPLPLGILEKCLGFVEENDSQQDKIDIKAVLLKIVGLYCVQNELIPPTIMDFVLQQFQIPELKILTVRVCCAIFVKTQGAGTYLSEILDKLYQCLINPESDTIQLIISTFKNITFVNQEENAITALIEIFHSTLEKNQYDDAIKILLLLYEVHNSFEDGQNKYNETVRHFFENFESMIWHLETNASMLMIHKLLVDLLRHNKSDLRLFAAKAILIDICYLMQSDDCDPGNDIPEIFLPLLLEKLNDPCLEIRKWIATGLCYLPIGEQVDPQLLVSYVESMLEMDHAAFLSVAILGLYTLLFHHHCFLSDTAILRISNLCLKKDYFDADTRNDSLALFSLQVQHTALPLDVEIIEQCTHFVVEEDSNPAKIGIAKNLLKLIDINFVEQSGLLTLPATIMDTVLNYLNVPEVRELAWDPYAALLSASEGLLNQKLMQKLFAALRNCARKSNPETKHFVLTCLGGIPDYQQKKDEILAIIAQPPVDTRTFSSIHENNPNTSLGEKDLNTLLRELRDLNPDNPAISQILTDHSLTNTLAAVKVAYTKDSQFVPAGKPIQEWDVLHCQSWSEAVIQDKTKARASDFQVELFAVIVRASVLDSDQIPRDIQLLTLLILLRSEAGGSLAEVKTGEGKTKIVAMFAAIKAFQFDFVDVVSSSSILARRDALETKNFFSILKLTVADNIDGQKHDGKAARKCYSANIVYGDTNEYQWDIIREAMGEKITRGNRPFNLIFFDEVDSLLVDRSENSAGINSQYPGFEYLNHIIVAVWHMMVRFDQCVRVENNQWIYKPSDAENEIIISDVRNFAMKLLKKYIINLIEDPNSPILLPKHLKNFALTHADEFADAAVSACYYYHLDKHYVIVDDADEKEVRKVIAPIDCSLTGEINKGSRWTYLHCYLELKHGLKMGSPQLMGNYLSTPGLCKRYGSNIYGLTGTLGGKDTQALFKEIYQLDIVFIPTYKPKCFLEYDGIVAPSKTDWLTTIINSVQNEVNRGRPVLVVAATIHDVTFLENELEKANCCRKITRFSRNDTEEIETPAHAIEPGEVIIATLLAGRGIDWHFASDVIEKRGGLHIIVTLLPLNLRVEQQIFGRTARKGNSGTAQIIVNRAEIQHKFHEDEKIYLDDMNNIKRWRDGMEAGRIYKIKTQSIRLALLKDDLYIKFRSFIKTLKNDAQTSHRIKGIEEQWVFWLQNIAKKYENDFNADTTLPLMESQFEEFLETVRDDQEIIRRNTCRQVQHGNALSYGGTGIKPDFSAAIAAFSQAIKDDPIVGVQAYYNRAEATILQKGKHYKDKVIEDLRMAKTRLEQNIIPQLQSMLVVHNLNPLTSNGLNNDFAKQILCKVELLKIEINNIDQNISIILHSRKKAKKAKQKVDFEISAYQTLSGFFPDAKSTPFAEIQDLHASGLIHLFEIQPIFRPKKGSSLGALCVALLGIVQIVVGVCISSIVPMIGSTLIEEGLNDLMYAARALITGQFNWNDYLATKIGSISISVISMGLNVLKTDLKFAAEAAQGQKALQNLNIRQLNYTQLLELAKKELVTRFIDTGIREALNFAVDQLTTGVMDSFANDIEHSIAKRLKKKLKSSDCQNALDTLLQRDLVNQNSIMQKQLSAMANRLICEKSNLFTTLSNTIIKGVLANQHAKSGTFICIANMGQALDKILHLTDNFSRKFKAEVLFFYHQQIAQQPTTSPNYNQIKLLKNQLYAGIARGLSQRIIATAKGEIINPSIGLAMDEHIQNIANLIKQAALRPTAIDYSATVSTNQPEVEKTPKISSETNDEQTSPEIRKQTRQKSAKAMTFFQGDIAEDFLPIERTLNRLENKNDTRRSDKPGNFGFPNAPTLFFEKNNTKKQMQDQTLNYYLPDIRVKEYRLNSQILFRSDTRNFSEIFHDGFKINYSTPQELGNGYISTALTKKHAIGYPSQEDIIARGAKQVYLYEIQRTKPGKNVGVEMVRRGMLEPFALNTDGFGYGDEIAIYEDIKPNEIKRGWVIDIETEKRSPEIIKERIKKLGIKNPSQAWINEMFIEVNRTPRDVSITNPNYNPFNFSQNTLRFFSAVKIAGNLATGAAILQDVTNFDNAYENSKIEGDSRILGRESTRIIGGWFGGITVGSAMATEGVTACAFLGPWAVACGVVSGIAGGYIGYRGGEIIANAYNETADNADITATANNVTEEKPKDKKAQTVFSTGPVVPSSKNYNLFLPAPKPGSKPISYYGPLTPK